MIDRRLVVLVFVVLAGCDKKEGAPSGLAQSILGSAAGSAASAKSGSAATTPSGSAAGSAGAAVPAAGSGSGLLAAADAAGSGTGSGSAAPAELKVGDRVIAKWTNGSWYPGKIAAIQANGTYDINFNDGDKSKGLPASKVKRPPPPRTGGKSGGGTAAASDAPCPGPGITRRCGGVCVNIQENNNHCGSCNNRCPSGKSCDGHMFCRDAAGNL